MTEHRQLAASVSPNIDTLNGAGTQDCKITRNVWDAGNRLTSTVVDSNDSTYPLYLDMETLEVTNSAQDLLDEEREPWG